MTYVGSQRLHGERCEVTLHTSTYPLDAINDAMADLDGGRLQGRGILITAEWGEGSRGWTLADLDLGAEAGQLRSPS